MGEGWLEDVAEETRMHHGRKLEVLSSHLRKLCSANQDLYHTLAQYTKTQQPVFTLCISNLSATTP